MLLQPNTKLLFIGDSITDCGRDRPVGEGWGLGNGYVSLLHALLNSTYPPASYPPCQRRRERKHGSRSGSALANGCASYQTRLAVDHGRYQRRVATVRFASPNGMARFAGRVSVHAGAAHPKN